MKQHHQTDVIIIGGGHAGIEASLAAAKMGCKTILITLSAAKIGEMSCNPSIGGVGKGQLVKEIDALGGWMGRAADYTGIQFKRLNTRKGSAVQSSRCQSDKKLYAKFMQKAVKEQPQLEVIEAEVKGLTVESGKITGVEIQTGESRTTLTTKTVVITAGTFMRGLMHCGFEKSQGGRFGEKNSVGLSDHLKELGIPILRLKTGTPPRLIRESIDFNAMETQWGDTPPKRFSFFESEIIQPQVPCFLTYTSGKTHEVIRKNLDKSPLYSGHISGIGPRYCPSIEDKVVKFPEKDRHPLFFEPESLTSNWIYPNGISTSLPAEVQEAIVRSLPGCQNAEIARPGYAVEYDCLDPRCLTLNFESKNISGLFFGGQVNGTSGYEEAGCQGLFAGINAALKAQEKELFTLKRSESYLGVLVDDLTTKGVSEPYRMFTSRAEYRLSLREDNADIRLTPHGRKLGLVTDKDFASFERKRTWLSKKEHEFTKTFVRGFSISQYLKRPEISIEDAYNLLGGVPPDISRDWLETLEIEIKYAGYIALQKQELERLKKMDHYPIAESLDYKQVLGLSTEIREKLGKSRPKTLAEASQISGITPAALTAILFHLRQKGSFSEKPSAAQ